MAYDVHVRIIAKGRFGSAAPGVDKWQFSLSYSAPSGLTTAQQNTMAVDMNAFIGRATTKISSSCITESITFATIGTTGHYTTVPYVVASTQAGGGVGNNTAPQVAWVVTYELAAASGTAIIPGGRRRGRFYLPGPVASVDSSTWQVAAADATALGTSAQTLINALNTDGGGQVVVASSKDGNHVVNRIRVGTALDTHRSRRRQLVEAYSVKTVP